MLKKLLVIIALVLVVLVVFINSKPSEFKVVRTAKIAAPAEKIFANVNDLHKWEAWSPWAKLDPNAKGSYSGAEAGVGAVMSWSGNMEVGEGSMTITESRPAEFIKFRLDFVKPLAGTNDAEFSFKEEGGETLVTWSMQGHSNFISKAMSLVFDCEKMVGEQFDKGLASLKGVAEGK